MPVIGAKLSQTDLVSLNRAMQQMGYSTLGEFLRDFARNKIANLGSPQIAERLTSLEQKVNLLVVERARWASIPRPAVPKTATIS